MASSYLNKTARMIEKAKLDSDLDYKKLKQECNKLSQEIKDAIY